MRKLLLLWISLLPFLSCQDFLDTDPVEQISIAEQLSTRDGVLAAISGIYGDLEALQSGKFHVYSGILSGNYTFSPSLTTNEINANSDARITSTYNFENTPDLLDYEAFYDDSYNIINQVNLLLEQKENFDFFTSTQLLQLEAELLAIRAFTHYHISLLFAQNINFTPTGSHPGIVYNQRTLRPAVDFPARVTVAGTYDLLSQDLDQALSLFTENQILPAGPASSYFNQITTTAVYAKIALQFNDWNKAATLAASTIENSGLSLTSSSNYLEQWRTNNDLNETILSFSTPRDADGSVSSSIAGFYSYLNEMNYEDFVASADLLELYSPQDIRSQLFDNQLITTITIDGRVDKEYFFTRKYQPDNQTLYLRLSEIYLIHAEALERLNPGNPIALQRLNLIRERAGLDPIINSTNLLEEVFLERQRELAFENSTYFDILRYQKNITRNQGCIATVCNLNYPSPFLVLPLPLQSILNNENMVQNEGY